MVFSGISACATYTLRVYRFILLTQSFIRFANDFGRENNRQPLPSFIYRLCHWNPKKCSLASFPFESIAPARKNAQLFYDPVASLLNKTVALDVTRSGEIAGL
jgi:hypothetical protein